MKGYRIERKCSFSQLEKYDCLAQLCSTHCNLPYFDDKYDTHWDNILELGVNWDSESKVNRHIYHYNGNIIFFMYNTDYPKNCWQEVFVIGKDEAEIIKNIKYSFRNPISKKEAQKIMEKLSLIKVSKLESRFMDAMHEKLRMSKEDVLKLARMSADKKQSGEDLVVDYKFVEEFEKNVKDPIFELLKEKEISLNLPFGQEDYKKLSKFHESLEF